MSPNGSGGWCSVACALIDRRLWIGRRLPHHDDQPSTRSPSRFQLTSPIPSTRFVHLCHITSIVCERTLWLLFGAIRSRNRGKPSLHRTRRPTLVTTYSLPGNPSSKFRVLNHQASPSRPLPWPPGSLRDLRRTRPPTTTMALPKRIIKETERLMAEPYAPPSSPRWPAQRCLTNVCVVSPESAPSHTTTTCDILTLRSTAPRNLHMKVCPVPSRPETQREVPDTKMLTHVQTGGVFKLELFLPDDYPMTPPKIRFLTKIFHPNVDKLGRICLDVLKSARWPRGRSLADISRLELTRQQTTGLRPCKFARSCCRSRPSWEPPTRTTLWRPTSPSRGRRTRLPR